MIYIEAIITLFAIVDPIGNIPMFLGIGEHIPASQRRQTFNTAVAVSVTILLVFSFAGQWILANIFNISMADLQLAGGILLLIIAIDHLLFGALKRSVTVNGTLTAYELGCVPLACPMLAGPGAMVTSINILQASGPLVILTAIITVFAITWLIMFFLEPIHKILGKLFCLVFSKVMCLFIAAIGVHMIIAGLQYYFN